MRFHKLHPPCICTSHLLTYPLLFLHRILCINMREEIAVGRKLKTALCALLAFVLVGLGFLCLWTSSEGFGMNSDTAALAAAALALPDGGYRLVNVYNTDSEEQEATSVDADSSAETSISLADTATIDETVYTENPAIYDNEAHLPVIETQYSSGEFGYNNFFVKNSTSFDLNIKEYLSRPLGFDFEDSDKVQVLIVHTHTSESYLAYDSGYYHKSFYPRSEDSEKNMTRVGRAIAEGLEAQGIGVIHAAEVHDNPAYDGAYSRSYDTIQKYLALYPDIKVVLDIHRDSISYSSGGGKTKPTFTYNGQKAAQIMIMAGYDPDGYYNFPFWEDNLTFALKLQNACEEMYPGMTRPLYFGNFAYNMNVNNGSLLIEIGTDVNTLAEAVYTGKLLSNVLAKVLQTG